MFMPSLINIETMHITSTTFQRNKNNVLYSSTLRQISDEKLLFPTAAEYTVISESAYLIEHLLYSEDDEGSGCFLCQ